MRQHRTIPALRLKHRSGSCGTASALPKCSIMSGCGTRIVLRGQKPLALCDRCPCFGSLFPPLAALTFAASSIICAFGLASAAPRSPYRHLELCGIALTIPELWHICHNEICRKVCLRCRGRCSPTVEQGISHIFIVRSGRLQWGRVTPPYHTKNCTAFGLCSFIKIIVLSAGAYSVPELSCVSPPVSPVSASGSLWASV